MVMTTKVLPIIASMRILSLVVGLVILTSAIVEGSTEVSSTGSGNDKDAAAHARQSSSDRHQRSRYLRSRRVQAAAEPLLGGGSASATSPPANHHDASPVPLALQPPNVIGILPVMLPSTLPQPAAISPLPLSTAAALGGDTPEETVAYEEPQGPTEAENGNGPAPDNNNNGSYNDQGEGNSESAPARDITPSASAASEESSSNSNTPSNEGRNITPPAGHNGSDTANNGAQGNHNGADTSPQGDDNFNDDVDSNGAVPKDESDDPQLIPLEDDLILQEIQQEERKELTLGGFGFLVAVALMIFTAWQMSDNPDGIYATMCRLIITIIGLFLRIVLTPCRSCLGGHHSNRHYAGHMPVSTMDYGYRDPALELS